MGRRFGHNENKKNSDPGACAHGTQTHVHHIDTTTLSKGHVCFKVWCVLKFCWSFEVWTMAREAIEKEFADGRHTTYIVRHSDPLQACYIVIVSND